VNAQVLLCRVLDGAVEELAAIVLAPDTGAEERACAERALLSCRASLEAAREGRLSDGGALVQAAHREEQKRQERARQRMNAVVAGLAALPPASLHSYLDGGDERGGNKRKRNRPRRKCDYETGQS
jgi:hypothetical protein